MGEAVVSLGLKPGLRPEAKTPRTPESDGGIMTAYVLDPKVVREILRLDMLEYRINPYEEEMKQAGRQEGIQEGILDALNVRFGNAPASLKLAVEQIHDDARLRDLFRRAITCAAIDEFQSALPGGLH